MKQGTKRRLDPKQKQDKKSWQTRNAARAGKQAAHAAAVVAERQAEAVIS